MDVTTETFERGVIERSRELPVVVDFWAAWCYPCRILGQAADQPAAEERARSETRSGTKPIPSCAGRARA